MDSLKIRIDGREIAGKRGMTILEAAGSAGIAIPSLCHHRNLAPVGACRICVVEVEGSNRLVGSCHTPIEEGMVVATGSPGVIAARKAIVELLMAGHTGPCLNDVHAGHCDLHAIASDLQSGPPRFRIRKPRYYEPEDANPYIRRDMSRCIMCSRCVSVCNDLAGKKVFGTAYRGFRSKVVVDFDTVLDKEICRECLLCVDYCPTSALGVPGKEKREPEDMTVPAGSGLRVPDRSRANLLPKLKKAQENFKCVPRGFIADTAQSTGLSIGDIYGVSTFYSFLSNRPTGHNVIRVCGSLPCYVKNSRAILQRIEEVLGIGPGETTPDGLFSLETANCIGACDRAPAMLVNSDLHGDLTPAKIARIIKSYRSGVRPLGERQCETTSS